MAVPSTLPELTRRAFLGRSCRALGVLALPWGAAGCGDGAPERPEAGGRVLGPGALRVLDAASDALIPPGGAFEAGAAGVGLARRVDAFLVAERPELVQGLRGGLWLVEWGAPLLAARAPRFSALARPEREAVLGALAASRLETPRLLFGGLKQLCFFVFYCQDESWPATGYEGPWLEGAVPGSAEGPV